MAKSIDLAPEASRLASLLLSYIPAVCAFVAPRHPGASTTIFDRLSDSRALSHFLKIGRESGSPISHLVTRCYRPCVNNLARGALNGDLFDEFRETIRSNARPRLRSSRRSC